MKQSDTGVKVGGLSVNSLLYADDAVLIASSECELQTSVTILIEKFKNNSLSQTQVKQRFWYLKEMKKGRNEKVSDKIYIRYTWEIC